jgi:N6-adenosine-specific RNA methylase IME4
MPDPGQLITDGPFAGLKHKHYRAGVIDVPWRYVMYSKKGEGRSPIRHYHCMDLAEIEALPVGDLFAKDAVIFMWVTDAFLKEGIRIAETWGFEYKTIGFHWVKQTVTGKEHMGQGYWTRKNPEICLLLTRGRPPRRSKAVRALITSVVREHSRKPEEAYERVPLLCDGPYLDLFSRQYRPGWSNWGNEVNKFASAPDHVLELVGTLPDVERLI